MKDIEITDARGYTMGGHLEDPHDFVKTRKHVPGPGSYADPADLISKKESKFAISKEKKSASYINSKGLTAPPPGSYSPNEAIKYKT